MILAVSGSLLEMAGKKKSSICDELVGSHMFIRNNAMRFQRYLVVCWKWLEISRNSALCNGLVGSQMFTKNHAK